MATPRLKPGEQKALAESYLRFRSQGYSGKAAHEAAMSECGLEISYENIRSAASHLRGRGLSFPLTREATGVLLDVCEADDLSPKDVLSELVMERYGSINRYPLFESTPRSSRSRPVV